MKIHSAKLTESDYLAAARYAGQNGDGEVYVTAVLDGRSQSHGIRWDVRLTGDGTVNRRPPMGTSYNSQMGGRIFAATYNSWGEFLAYLYGVDATMKAGPYKDLQDFVVKTSANFAIPGYSREVNVCTFL